MTTISIKAKIIKLDRRTSILVEYYYLEIFMEDRKEHIKSRTWSFITCIMY